MLPVRSALTAIPRASRITTRPVISRAYHEKVISHYERPRNVRDFRSHSLFHLSDNLALFLQVGSLPKNDIDVGTGLVGAPAYVTRSHSCPAERAD
jgi:iron-sulfur cluster assembly enzyme ISCU, mitochondrial